MRCRRTSRNRRSKPARSRTRRKQLVVLVGHSLGGHGGLAAQGTGLVSFDGVACVGANVWLRELEPLRARWMAKRAVLAASAGADLILCAATNPNDNTPANGITALDAVTSALTQHQISGAAAQQAAGRILALRANR